MKVVGGNLYVEWNELAQLGISKKTIDKGVQDYRAEASKSWACVKDPDDRRKCLVNLDSIPGRSRKKLPATEDLVKRYKAGEQEAKAKKEAILAQFERPDIHPIVQLLGYDLKAQSYYLEYTLPNGRKLPERVVDGYIKAANWLNMLAHFDKDPQALKRQLNMDTSTLYAQSCLLITEQGIGLPSSERRLKARVKSYVKEGYESLVEAWRFGNENSKKVNDEVAEALLLQLISHPHQHDDTIIAIKYNEWAKANGRKVITAAAVGHWRRDNRHLVTAQREGLSKNYNEFSPRIKRSRPSAPMLLINSDDNILDLFFNEQRAKGDYHYWRPAMYVVMDAFNDYILGYAIGETITIDLIKEAYLNAANHVAELTGNYYLWDAIQSDRWAIGKEATAGSLREFFEKQAIFIPATAKVAQGKYIERAFGTTWHQQLKLYNNYSGHNVKAVESIDRDWIDANKKYFPMKEQAADLIAEFIGRMRATVNPRCGKTRQREWVDAFFASEKARNRQITSLEMLHLFGVAHHKTNKITAAGLTATLLGHEKTFEIPQNHYLENVGKTVQIYYNPYNLQEILITDGNGLRFTAQEVQEMPSAPMDFKEGDRKRLNAKLDFKKQVNAHIGEARISRETVLERSRIDAFSLLQSGNLLKAGVYEATRAIEGREAFDSDSEEVFDVRSQY